MKRVNLKEYTRFWLDFAQRCADIDPSMSMSSHQVKRYLKEWYDITVHVTSSGEFAQVYMLERDHVAFLLKWT